MVTHLPDGWGLVRFWGSDEHTVRAFVLRNGQTPSRLFLVNCSSSTSVREAIAQMWGGWHSPELVVRPSLEKVADRLFGPLLEGIVGLKGLYIVTDPWFANFPFAAIVRSLPDRATIEHVSVIPSTTMLCRSPEVPECKRGLTLANPERGTEHTLPFAELEARGLTFADGLGYKHTVVCGNAATADTLSQTAPLSVLHVAAHGEPCAPDGGVPRIRLAGEELTVDDILDMPIPLAPGALVVLSVCQGAYIGQAAPSAPASLANAFLSKGAGTVLASPFPIADFWSSQIVREFLHQTVALRRSPAEALAIARTQASTFTVTGAMAVCTELFNRFPPDQWPHEAARVHVEAMRVCVQAHDAGGIQDHASRARRIYNGLELPCQAGATSLEADRALDRCDLNPRWGRFCFPKAHEIWAHQLYGIAHAGPA